LADNQASDIAGVPFKTYKKMEQNSFLSVQASENVISLSELYEIGLTALDGKKDFLNWLNSSIPALNEHRPIELITTTYVGIILVKEVLSRIEYGVLD